MRRRRLLVCTVVAAATSVSCADRSASPEPCDTYVDLELRFSGLDRPEESVFIEGCQEEPPVYDAQERELSVRAAVDWSNTCSWQSYGDHSPCNYGVVLNLALDGSGDVTPFGPTACYVQGPRWPGESYSTGFSASSGVFEFGSTVSDLGETVEGTVDCAAVHPDTGVEAHMTGSFEFLLRE